MSIEVSGTVISIVGHAAVEDAEPLLAALHEDSSRTVDLHQAVRLHTALVRLLLALRPRIVGVPTDPFFATYLLPLLDRDRGSA
ncbi:hypothetical protein Q4F19_20175 [Sphingomonas sp. BIUV-7]|uniref:STAS domain-containing protein n=1 Tax=Sphingomonas natans TaxID=3063330 RepID=A0ABT8YFP4_9SPHN|nr:hypothetical protein [Sphingomonas sp. BIUV-7]MDO6416713.1 hypothetical protein [Sphingomonas sp. BIUV-7]